MTSLNHNPYVKKEFNQEAQIDMPSNIVDLSAELATRQDKRILTPKQKMTVLLRNSYIKHSRLKRASEFHKKSYFDRIKDVEEITKRIEILEENMLRES